MAGAALVERIKERALSLGLGPAGIAPIAPSDHAAALRRWLDRGMEGTMSWMRRTARDSVDLRARFSWARSAVVVAQPYLPYRGDRHQGGGLVPHVARYAVGRDYHATLAARLAALAAFLREERPDARTRVYVDTGPILERELAARAGLGWLGKSTNLIAPGGDSWRLLGQVLTSLDLPPDAPAADRCGSCTACLDACPTAAITEPYVVDSNRCISYLTIELKDRLPPGRAQDLGDWIFGCDVCQEVCPWNQRAEPVDDPAFLPAAALRETTLADLLRLDETAFRARFTGTPFERPGRRGVLRNALAVAANTSDDAALLAAERLRRDPDPVLREAADAALQNGRDPRNPRESEV